MTESELRAELALPAYAGKTAQQKTDMLNAPKAGVEFPVIVPKGTVLAVMARVPQRIATLSAAGQAECTQTLANIRSLEQGLYTWLPDGHPLKANTAYGFDRAVELGAMIAEEKTLLETLGKRTGSRAEELWGEGTSVSLNDVARVS